MALDPCVPCACGDAGQFGMDRITYQMAVLRILCEISAGGGGGGGGGSSFDILCDPATGDPIIVVRDGTTGVTSFFELDGTTPFVGTPVVCQTTDTENVVSCLRVTVAGAWGSLGDIISDVRWYDTSTTPPTLTSQVYINQVTQAVVAGVLPANTEPCDINGARELVSFESLYYTHSLAEFNNGGEIAQLNSGGTQVVLNNIETSVQTTVVLGTTVTSPQSVAVSRDKTLIYALGGAGATQTIYTFTIAGALVSSFAVTAVGILSIYGIAVHPVTDALYGIRGVNTTNEPALYLIDPTTGTSSVVSVIESGVGPGSAGGGGANGALAITPSGRFFFAMKLSSQNFYYYEIFPLTEPPTAPGNAQSNSSAAFFITANTGSEVPMLSAFPYNNQDNLIVSTEPTVPQVVNVGGQTVLYEFPRVGSTNASRLAPAFDYTLLDKTYFTRNYYREADGTITVQDVNSAGAPIVVPVTAIVERDLQLASQAVTSKNVMLKFDWKSRFNWGQFSTAYKIFERRPDEHIRMRLSKSGAMGSTLSLSTVVGRPSMAFTTAASGNATITGLIEAASGAAFTTVVPISKSMKIYTFINGLQYSGGVANTVVDGATSGFVNVPTLTGSLTRYSTDGWAPTATISTWASYAMHTGEQVALNGTWVFSVTTTGTLVGTPVLAFDVELSDPITEIWTQNTYFDGHTTYTSPSGVEYPGQPVGSVIVTGVATPGTATVQVQSLTGAGYIDAGASSVTIRNSGAGTGVVNGVTVGIGSSYTFSGYFDPATQLYNRLQSFYLDGTGTTLDVAATF
jgi:hypothetical protein